MYGCEAGAVYQPRLRPESGNQASVTDAESPQMLPALGRARQGNPSQFQLLKGKARIKGQEKAARGLVWFRD